MERIRKDRGPPGEAFFQDEEGIAQMLLEQTGPAFFLIETVTMIRTVRRQ